jgi:AcrR family transcriptional regulator
LATRIPSRPETMRKQPRQARSRATVEAILDAGAQVLGRQGWAGFTTNEVAEASGVSIGSLYQYFPNKLVLIEAITRRHFDDVLAVLRTIDDDTMPLSQRVDRLVHGMIAIHSANPALHRALLEDAPSSKALQSAHDLFETEYLRRYEALVASAGGRRKRVADQAAAQVLSAAVAGAIHDAARRGTLTTPAMKQELVELVCAYLIGRQRPDADVVTRPSR